MSCFPPNPSARDVTHCMLYLRIKIFFLSALVMVSICASSGVTKRNSKSPNRFISRTALDVWSVILFPWLLEARRPSVFMEDSGLNLMEIGMAFLLFWVIAGTVVCFVILSIMQ